MTEKDYFKHLFAEFAKAPMADFLKYLMRGLTKKQRDSITIEALSYERRNANTVKLTGTFFCASAQVKWLSADVDLNEDDGDLSVCYILHSDDLRSVGGIKEWLEESKG